MTRASTGMLIHSGVYCFYAPDWVSTNELRKKVASFSLGRRSHNRIEKCEIITCHQSKGGRVKNWIQLRSP